MCWSCGNMILVSESNPNGFSLTPPCGHPFFKSKLHLAPLSPGGRSGPTARPWISSPMLGMIVSVTQLSSDVRRYPSAPIRITQLTPWQALVVLPQPPSSTSSGPALSLPSPQSPPPSPSPTSPRRRPGGGVIVRAQLLQVAGVGK